jgi:hypothetical protein
MHLSEALQERASAATEVACFEHENVADDDARSRNRSDLPSRRTFASGAVIFFSAAMDFSALNS